MSPSWGSSPSLYRSCLVPRPGQWQASSQRGMANCQNDLFKQIRLEFWRFFMSVVVCCPWLRKHKKASSLVAFPAKFRYSSFLIHSRELLLTDFGGFLEPSSSNPLMGSCRKKKTVWGHARNLGSKQNKSLQKGWRTWKDMERHLWIWLWVDLPRVRISSGLGKSNLRASARWRSLVHSETGEVRDIRDVF